MRRSVNGRASERDGELCMAAYKSNPKEYGDRHRRVKVEEVAALKAMYRGFGR